MVLQSASSEIIPIDQPIQTARNLKVPKAFEKKMCATIETFGLKACTEIESHSAAFLRDTPLYVIVGKHAVFVKVAPGK